MSAAILLRQVNKSFGRVPAVQGMDLDIPMGGLYGFIGPNGAGKTTTIRMIMAILFPDSGTLEVLGRSSPLDAKDRIGYLPEERGVYRKMRVGAFLRFMAGLKRVPDAEASQRIGALLERVGLADVDRKRCEELSKGMLQKVQIVAAIVHRPELLILDEPFSGLDPVGRRLVRDIILDEHRRGATVLFSTHVMPQAEEICEHIVMVYRGRKVLDEPLASIRRRADTRRLFFEPLDHGADLSPITALPVVEAVEQRDGHLEVRLAPTAEPGAAIQAVAAAVPPARLEIARPRLEDVFVELAAGEAGSAADTERLRAELRDNEQGAA